MHYLDGREIPLPCSKHFASKQYHANAIRDEFDKYDCSSSVYVGRYQLEGPSEVVDDDTPAHPIYIVGSWDGFEEARGMLFDKNANTWSCLVCMGETRCERFQLRVAGDPMRAIYPAARDGSMQTRVMGPWKHGEARYWLLDGRDSKVPEGTVFEVTFRWGLRHSITWRCIGDVECTSSPLPILGAVSNHEYSLLTSSSFWTCTRMPNVSSATKPNAWETVLTIGKSGSECFRFCRDQDRDQQIYPVRTVLGAEAELVPVRGPDELCNGKHWQIAGAVGERFRISLQVADAMIILNVESQRGPSKAWTATSIQGPGRHSYCVRGSITNGKIESMLLREEGHRTSFYYRGTARSGRLEHFVVLVDEDPGVAFYPMESGCPPGVSLVGGPGTPEGKEFQFHCIKDGAEFEIVLDLASTDKRRIVDMCWLSDRVDVDSLKDVFVSYFA